MLYQLSYWSLLLRDRESRLGKWAPCERPLPEYNYFQACNIISYPAVFAR